MRRRRSPHGRRSTTRPVGRRPQPSRRSTSSISTPGTAASPSSLKESAGLYRLHLPLTASDLEQRLELALVHYHRFRPHEGLRGAVPAEVFLAHTDRSNSFDTRTPSSR